MYLSTEFLQLQKNKAKNYLDSSFSSSSCFKAGCAGYFCQSWQMFIYLTSCSGFPKVRPLWSPQKAFSNLYYLSYQGKNPPSYNYPQLHTLFIGSQTLVCSLPGNCHLCSSRLFSVSNTLSPHHFCLWLCPPKLPVVGYVPCLGFWYNPGSCCFLFFCCMTQFTHAHFLICYLIFFLSSDLHFSLLFCINKNKSLSLALISFIFFFPRQCFS